MAIIEVTETSGTSYVGQRSVDAAIDFLGGCAGGTASVYVGQPLDTVKVKMQTFPSLYRNSFRCLLETVKQDGIRRGLYAGTVPSLVAQVLENAILFFTYGLCQKGVMLLSKKKNASQLNLAENAVCGSCAGFFAALALCPTELIKCKLQGMREMATSRRAATLQRSPWSLTKEILRTEGILGMYAGMTSTLVREMVGYSFFFGGYELTKRLLSKSDENREDLGPVRTIICGGVGGIAFWTATFPADVIKSRVQVEGKKPNKSFIYMLVYIFRNEGIGALYTGLGPCLLRTFPATGALFLAYETSKKWVQRVVYGEQRNQ